MRMSSTLTPFTYQKGIDCVRLEGEALPVMLAWTKQPLV